MISDLNNAIQGLMQGGVSETDRQRVVSLLTQHTTMSQQEAQGFVQQIETTRQEAQQQIAQAQESAREIGGDVADALTAAAIWSLIALILSGVAAALGGTVGRVKGFVKV